MALVVVVAWDCEPALCSFVLDALMPPGHGCRFAGPRLCCAIPFFLIGLEVAMMIPLPK